MPNMVVEKIFSFDSAHFLPNVPEDHKCRNLHGHTYTVKISVSGELDPKMGWVFDFGEVKKVAKPLIKRLDHSLLNEIEGLENPTAENLAFWFWNQMKLDLPNLFEITIMENPTNIVRYRGN